MSRLLFAAARGARVQRQQQAIHSDRTWWECVDIQWGLDDELRIHPDDEHLQYGPISSALRGMADVMDSYAIDNFYWSAAREVAETHEADWSVCVDSELHRSLFLLFLAEALADEGL